MKSRVLLQSRKINTVVVMKMVVVVIKMAVAAVKMRGHHAHEALLLNILAKGSQLPSGVT